MFIRQFYTFTYIYAKLDVELTSQRKNKTRLKLDYKIKTNLFDDFIQNLYSLLPRRNKVRTSKRPASFVAVGSSGVLSGTKLFPCVIA